MVQAALKSFTLEANVTEMTMNVGDVQTIKADYQSSQLRIRRCHGPVLL